jgi:hypothetical protein
MFIYIHWKAFRSRYSSVVWRWATEWLGVRFPTGAGNFSLHHRVQNALWPTQPPIQRVLGALSLGGKAAGAWSWSLTSFSCRNQGWLELYLHSTSTPSWRGVQLRKAQGQLYFFTVCACERAPCVCSFMNIALGTDRDWKSLYECTAEEQFAAKWRQSLLINIYCPHSKQFVH